MKVAAGYILNGNIMMTQGEKKKILFLGQHLNLELEIQNSPHWNDLFYLMMLAELSWMLFLSISHAIFYVPP